MIDVFYKLLMSLHFFIHIAKKFEINAILNKHNFSDFFLVLFKLNFGELINHSILLYSL